MAEAIRRPGGGADIVNIGSESARVSITGDTCSITAAGAATSIRVQARTVEVETIRVSVDLNVDLAPDGTVYGLELLNATAQLRAEDGGALVVINEALGDRREAPLSA